jgi:hypothetical protein
MKPTVGRIVHYWGSRREPIAAVITQVYEHSAVIDTQMVELFIFPCSQAGLDSGENRRVSLRGLQPEGHDSWDWPPRES